MSVQNFSFLARLEVAEKFVVAVGWSGGPGQVQGSALVKLSNKHNESINFFKLISLNYTANFGRVGDDLYDEGEHGEQEKLSGRLELYVADPDANKERRIEIEGQDSIDSAQSHKILRCEKTTCPDFNKTFKRENSKAAHYK